MLLSLPTVCVSNCDQKGDAVCAPLRSIRSKAEALLFIRFLSVICVIMGKNTPTRLLFRRKAAKPARRPVPTVEKNPAKRFFDSFQKGTRFAPPFAPSKSKRKNPKIIRQRH